MAVSVEDIRNTIIEVLTEIDDTIEVVKHEKFDNSLVVKKADGSNLTIGAKAIDYIFVETR